jgi:hypothetical protein
VTRRSFYQSVVYLSTSKLSVVVLANAALAAALAFTAGLKAVFLGPLRTNEVSVESRGSTDAARAPGVHGGLCARSWRAVRSRDAVASLLGQCLQIRASKPPPPPAGQVERVNETLRFTIPEVCIALTVFREELSLRILGLFLGLLVSKFFHVVADERLNHVSVEPQCRRFYPES